jgi:hypothetical protein
MKSPIGEEYEVVRFFTEATGNPDCPFVQGELRLEPLIFVDDELVGWKWSYLSDVLGQRLSVKATRWNFGTFCGGRPTSPTDAEPGDAEPSEPVSPASPPEEESANPQPSPPHLNGRSRRHAYARRPVRTSGAPSRAASAVRSSR